MDEAADHGEAEDRQCKEVKQPIKTRVVGESLRLFSRP
jgi:hypothetical protein